MDGRRSHRSGGILRPNPSEESTQIRNCSVFRTASQPRTWVGSDRFFLISSALCSGEARCGIKCVDGAETSASFPDSSGVRGGSTLPSVYTVPSTGAGVDVVL